MKLPRVFFARKLFNSGITLSANPTLRDIIIARLHEEGFPLVGTCSPRPYGKSIEAYNRWLNNKYHAGMSYMASNPDVRMNTKNLVPWARGAFVVAIPYNTLRDNSDKWVKEGRGWISRYAWGRDYHKVIRGRLKKAASILEHEGFRAKTSVDSTPVLERDMAVRAGIGFMGKNTMLINRQWGSYLFLGEIITDMKLDDTEPADDGCGGCEICLKACPAGALVEPGILDSRRCLSYLTIEHRGDFSDKTPNFNGNLFGCDICQEGCPYNRNSPLSDEREFAPKEGCFAPESSEIASLSYDEWDLMTGGTAIRRAGYDGLRRNARKVIEESDSGTA